MIACRTSRYVVDVNRGEEDVDGEVVEGASSGVRMHHGLVWRTTADGEPALARKLTRAELEERLDLVWRPYHRALSQLIERKRARFGLAIVVAAHSMPSVERTSALDLLAAPGAASASPARSRSRSPEEPRIPRARADVVPGTRGRRSADARIIDAVEEHAVERGWTVRHDDPYAGGFTTQHYGKPAEGIHAVQVELARRLYLDETTLRPARDFAAVKDWCRELVAKLGKVGRALAVA